MRVKAAPETNAAGIAGCVGIVYGITTVSSTGVEVIGTPTDDTAINVSFKDTSENVWLAPSLLEFLDHSPGITTTVKGSTTKLTRDPSGEWVESRRRLPLSEWPARVGALIRRAVSRK